MLNFLIHVKELKFRIYYILLCFINTCFSCYLHMPQLINIISIHLSPFVSKDNFDFIYTNIFEIFNSYISLLFYTISFFCIPFVYYSIISFIKPGLYSYEKQLFFNILALNVRLILLSSFLCYFFFIPYTLFFLFELNILNDLNFIILKNNISLYNYNLFIYKFLFIYTYGIFQIPVLISVFIFLKKPTYLFFFKLRRVWFIFSFILGCFLSSSDFLSFLLISILICFFFETFTFSLTLKYKYTNILNSLL